jgi:drug/metabolite transporter (DMT)-like permease
MVLFGTGPLFIPLLEKLIFSVRVSIENTMALVVTFIGVILLAGDQGGFNVRVELLVGLAAGFFNAGSQLSLYRVSHSRLNAVEINLWTFLFASVVLVPVMIGSIIAEKPLYQNMAHPELVAVALGALSVLIINTQVFRSKAYKFAQSGSQLAPLIFTSLIFSALWQVIFYNETYNFYQILGLVLILGANILGLSVSHWKKHRTLEVRPL